MRLKVGIVICRFKSINLIQLWPVRSWYFDMCYRLVLKWYIYKIYYTYMKSWKCTQMMIYNWFWTKKATQTQLSIMQKTLSQLIWITEMRNMHREPPWCLRARWVTILMTRCHFLEQSPLLPMPLMGIVFIFRPLWHGVRSYCSRLAGNFQVLPHIYIDDAITHKTNQQCRIGSNRRYTCPVLEYRKRRGDTKL